MDKAVEQYLVDIIGSEMDLTVNQVWVRDQNRTIPNDAGIYVVVGLSDSSLISSTTEITEESFNSLLATETGNALTTEAGIGLALDSERYTVVYENQRTQNADTIQIDIFSRDNSALLRRNEVLMALKSFYSQRVQEQNSFKISRLPTSFLNTSGAEGGSNLKRYTITIRCLTWSAKKKLLGDFFDDFKTRVDDEKTIGTATGVIEFEIAADTAFTFSLNNELGGALLLENGLKLGLDARLYNGP